MVKKDILKYFSDKKNKVLFVKTRKEQTALHDWHKVRNPLKTLLNFMVINLCKILTLSIKNFLFRKVLSMNIGKDTAISPGVDFDYFYPELVSIGKKSIVGLNVKILTHEFTHDYFRFARVEIGDKCLIGAFTNIRAGVKIGDNSIVAMNSFVNKDVPENELWGGVPAKFIKKLE